MDPHYKPPLPVPQSALQIHAFIVAQIKKLVDMPEGTASSNDFKKGLMNIYELFDKYQTEVLKHNSVYKQTCNKGCAHCCFHYVEDVNSFEGEMIANYIREMYPHQIPALIQQCKDDIAHIEHLDQIIFGKLQAEDASQLDLDHTDLLLSSFYQLRRPCPLLDKHGSCLVYPVRPLTCRIYMSFSDPSRCKPEYINDDDIPTYLLDLEEDANSLLDELHFKQARFEGDTGLRSLLVKYLEEGKG